MNWQPSCDTIYLSMRLYLRETNKEIDRNVDFFQILKLTFDFSGKLSVSQCGVTPPNYLFNRLLISG